MAIARRKPFSGVPFNQCLATVRGAPEWSAFLTVPSPEELRAIYAQGFLGVIKDATPEAKKDEERARMAQPSLYEAFPWAKGIGKGKRSTPYVACQKLIEGWGGLNAQVQGDCTVHGTEHATEIDYCNDCLWGETKFMGQIAFENIYRSRGFGGDGWSCTAPTRYIGPEGKGGLLYRKVWEGPDGEKVDLTRYNSSWQSNGRAGVPAWLEEISRQNKAKWIIQIGDMEEYRDCIALAFGINFCSGQGYASSTDEFGVAVPRGGWSHAMGHTMCDDTPWAHSKYGEMLGGIQNSWGKWNTINGKPEGAPPLATGSFYTKSSGIARLLDGDQKAVVSVYGWERTNWEAFDVIGYKDDLLKHLRNSTTQDYYYERSLKIQELSQQVAEEFIAI